jgi:hypothetical protein
VGALGGSWSGDNGWGWSGETRLLGEAGLVTGTRSNI